MTLQLILARHGLTDWNTTGRFQGHSDIPLNTTGLGQVAALGKRLATMEINTVYASDLLRAWGTAQAIMQYHSCPLTPEPRLRELSFGDWEGLTYTEIQERAPGILSTWQADMLNTAAPGGETLIQLTERVQAVLDMITTDHPDGTVLLVAHGGTLQALLCLALGLPPQAYWQFSLSPASLSKVRMYPEGAVLNLLNDTCHLEAEV